MSRREVLRRSLHIALGAGAFLVPGLGWAVLLALCLVAALLNAWLLPRFGGTRWLLREGRDDGHRGLVLYPLAIALVTLVFREDLRPIQAGWIALAVGDGLAPFLGLGLRRPRWPWNPRKAVSASAGAFGIAFLAMLLFVSPPAAAMAALLGCLAESLPDPVDDNLVVPLAAATGVRLVLGAPA